MASKGRKLLIESLKPFKMRLPVGVAQAGDGDSLGLVGVDELVVPDIDSHVGDAFFVCIFEKDEIAGLRVVNVIRTAVVAFGGIAADFLAGLVRDIIDEPTAVKAGEGAAAPNIRDTHQALRIRHHLRGKITLLLRRSRCRCRRCRRFRRRCLGLDLQLLTDIDHVGFQVVQCLQFLHGHFILVANLSKRITAFDGIFRVGRLCWRRCRWLGRCRSRRRRWFHRGCRCCHL